MESLKRWARRRANAVLWLFGRKLVQKYIGRWRVGPNGIYRTLIPIGWRVAMLSEPEGETEFERLARNTKNRNERRTS